MSLHAGAFGGQTVQEPARQLPEAHAGSSAQVPVVSHVCCVVGFLHCVLPGTHMPEHMPVDAEQRNGQSMSVFQVPVPSQLCWLFPTH